MAVKAVPFNPNKAWSTPGYGYAPGFFGPTRAPKIPKGIPVDTGVPGNANIRGGINAKFLQDPGVPGQVMGDYSPIESIDDYIKRNTPGGGGDGDGGGTDKETQKKIFSIEGDPEYLDALRMRNLRGQNAMDALRLNVRRAIAGAGYDPFAGAQQLGVDLRSRLSGQFAGLIDDPTVTDALSNPWSQRAQLEQSRQKQMGSLVDQLAARGILRSGAFTAGSEGIAQNYQGTQHQQLQDLLDTISSGMGGYTSGMSDLDEQLAAARRGVALRLATQNPDAIIQ
jgi:hypothetical protein